MLCSPNEKWRRIKFGIAKKCWFLISRKSHLRIEFGLFELSLAKYVCAFSRNANIAYDIGAEMGYYSLAFLRCMGGSGKVYAFEANEERVLKFSELVKRNNAEERIKVFEAYVTNEEDLDLGSSLKKISLDSFVYKQGNPAPNVIKMDIEGEELKALQGAEKMLREYRPRLMIEIHSRDLAIQCPAYLEKLGYKVRTIKQGWFNKLFPEARFDGRNEYNGYLVAE